ncbi:MAG: hypothetical protein WC836_03445 [Desulfobacula sp.]
MKKIIIVLLSAFLFMGASYRPGLVGKWENSEKLIDAKPGEIKIFLKNDGTGDLILDKEKYFWVADKFLYKIIGNQVEVVFIYEDGEKTDPGRLDIIKLSSKEMILGFKEADLKLAFRKIN